MKLLATALLVPTLACLAGCTHATRAQHDLENGWVAFGTVGPATVRGVDPETTPEHVAEFVDSGKRVVLTGRVEQVCKTMGCWLDIKGPSGATVRVMNRDHAFFIPRNARGRKVHAIGYATVREQSVDVLKHLAMDAGKPQAEIDAIVTPERTVLFIADAVILPPGGLDAPATAPAASEGESK
jgi:hypothetical protein